MNINPFALLASVLYHLDDKVKCRMKPDDASESIEIEEPMVQIRSDGESLLCLIPLSKVMHYQKNQYDARVDILEDKEGIGMKVLAISFEPSIKAPLIVNGSGQKIGTHKTVLERLLHGNPITSDKG